MISPCVPPRKYFWLRHRCQHYSRYFPPAADRDSPANPFFSPLFLIFNTRQGNVGARRASRQTAGKRSRGERKELAGEGDRQSWEGHGSRGGGGGASAERDGAERRARGGGNVLTPPSFSPSPFPSSLAHCFSADLAPDVRGLPRLARQR